MAKLLIIDDQVKMVRILQEYLSQINGGFTPENTFYFEDTAEGQLEIRPVSSLENENRLVRFRGKDNEFKTKMLEFLKQYGHSAEDVLVIIDVLLNSQDIVAPSVDKYFEDEEYSYELYMELMRIKTGISTDSSIDKEKVYFFVFSRSEIGCPLFAKILYKGYAGKDVVKGKITPPEWYQPESIAWCKNNLEAVDKNGIVQGEPKGNALDLTEGYRKFIAGLK